MIKRLIDSMAANPALFIFLRRILENDFQGEKQVLKQELGLPNGKVLDIGCGTGELSVLFPPDRYVGIDISPAYIEFARHHYAAEFHVMDATALNFADGTFGSAVIVGVLHHLNDELSRALLREAGRVLASGGRLVLLEDVVLAKGTHPIGRLIHLLDKGDHIRPAAEYKKLLPDSLVIQKEYLMRSGVCDYIVLVIEKKSAC
ncbi:MAG: class I SAM-dependent methyltransferase [candidate division KSB1 bacterium]|nr:class I SAM-dependent methyltransferase [candidate division KSB1 bacterium]